MTDKLHKRTMIKNANRIAELDMAFGHLHHNASQTVRDILDLTIPCAHLIKAGIVLAVVDSFDSVNDQAVSDMERYCREAIKLATDNHGEGWYTVRASQLLPKES